MDCVLLKVFASIHGLSYGGAKARTEALHAEILWYEGFAAHIANSRLPISRCVPLHRRKRDRGQLCRDEESCIIIHHDESSCMTHGVVVMLVLRLPESVCVIPWPVVRWCKGTNGGASLRDFEVCGAKASHHTPQALAFRLRGVCLCTTGEETAVSWAVARTPA